MFTSYWPRRASYSPSLTSFVLWNCIVAQVSLALYWWTNRDLLLYFGSTIKDHGNDIRFLYVILKWISNWKGVSRSWWTCLIDCFHWFWVVIRLIIGSWYTSLSMASYKVLCDNLVGCLGIGQDQTKMPLWISNHGEYNKRVHTIGEGWEQPRFLCKCVSFSKMSNGVWNWQLCDSFRYS